MAGANDWGTPSDLVRACEILFQNKFTLDVCAHRLNAKCARYYADPYAEYPGGEYAQDGLAQHWVDHSDGGMCWMNPPYTMPKRDDDGQIIFNSKGKPVTQNVIEHWTKKASGQAKAGQTTIALIRVDFSAKWFSEIVLPAAYSIHPLIGARVRYDEVVDGKLVPGDTPNFSSMIVRFAPNPSNSRHMHFWDWRKTLERGTE